MTEIDRLAVLRDLHNLQPRRTAPGTSPPASAFRPYRGKSNEALPHAMGPCKSDHSADCIRDRLRHNTQPIVNFKRRWVA